MLFIILYTRTINSITRAECNIFLPMAGLYFQKSQKTIIAHFAIFAVETALCRKLNRVPPLRHVLDLFTLVNLMNQFRGVIDQTHGHDNRAARLVKLIATCGALDIDDPQPAITLMMPDED
jgi:hypothetical protein